MSTSLFETITEALVDGRLPEGFRLPTEDGDAMFMDGAKDGILVYHRSPGHELTGEQAQLITDAVERISGGEFYDAEELVWRIADEIGPLDAHDPLRNAIAQNAQRLELGNLFHFGMVLAQSSDRREHVKVALSILSLFQPDEAGKQVVRTLGLSDELTLFAAAAMSAWDDANREYFALAQKVRGWGRIHLVARLEPETEAIRHWLLTEGVHNDILPAYSAMPCFEKAGVPALLEGDALSREEFSGIRDILLALTDEGPVPGLSAIEDAPKSIRLFLNHAKTISLSEEDNAAIASLRDKF